MVLWMQECLPEVAPVRAGVRASAGSAHSPSLSFSRCRSCNLRRRSVTIYPLTFPKYSLTPSIPVSLFVRRGGLIITQKEIRLTKE